ncbi:MAG TPA: DUF3352 domain-containing protein [Nocardioidaceae bacterium]|nr:DUF3352 domain-containing protein [Nocardioidaceae bacterium]
MSSNTPFGPGDGFPPASGSPEYLGAGEPNRDQEPSGRGRWPVLGAVAVGVAAVVGLGGWGAFTLLSGGGAQPADVLPASTVGYVSLDLDPSASQKIEAFQMLKKFPALKQELGLDTTDDLRRLVFDKLQEDGTCTDLDYESDIKPWVGERVALAAVPDAKPGLDAPVVALQVRDQDKATSGIKALAGCAGAEDDFGFAFTENYVLLTDSQKRADALVDEAAAGSLADDAAFRDWTGKVGDPGILTMYAAAGAPAYLGDLRSGGWTSYDGNAELMAEAESMDTEMNEQMKALYKDFKGMAVTVRFDDGAVDAELAGQGLPAGISSADGSSGPSLADLPASTGAALSIGLPDGWLDQWLESMAGFWGSGESVEDMLTAAEAETGLTLPEDIETLFGDGVSISFDADTDLEALFDAGDLSRLPVGLRVAGDPAEIMPVVDKLRAAIGPDADMVVVEPGDDVVAFGLNRDYVQALLGGGSLGEEDAFQRVVPDADEATAALYVNFDAGGGWAEDLADELAATAGPDPSESDAQENIAPLDALGVSTWRDGDVQRGLLRLTTD